MYICVCAYIHVYEYVYLSSGGDGKALISRQSRAEQERRGGEEGLKGRREDEWRMTPSLNSDLQSYP